MIGTFLLKRPLGMFGNGVSKTMIWLQHLKQSTSLNEFSTYNIDALIQFSLFKMNVRFKLFAGKGAVYR